MSELALNRFSARMDYPTSTTPAWNTKVERWYQLDAASFVLSETFWQNREALTGRPEWLLLASPQASNLTDSQFTTGTPSPAKFVHTLPNIRSASLLQVMGWSGKVLCLQNDPTTLLTAMSEGMHLAAEGDVWIATVEAHDSAFNGHIFVLSPRAQRSNLKLSKNSLPSRSNALSHDKELLLWLNRSERNDSVFIADRCEIFKSRE